VHAVPAVRCGQESRLIADSLPCVRGSSRFSFPPEDGPLVSTDYSSVPSTAVEKFNSLSRDESRRRVWLEVLGRVRSEIPVLYTACGNSGEAGLGFCSMDSLGVLPKTVFENFTRFRFLIAKGGGELPIAYRELTRGYLSCLQLARALLADNHSGEPTMGGDAKGSGDRATVEYWGLPSICQRMQWRHRLTPVRHAMKYGFPLYVRIRLGQRRQMYYSNEALIKAWEWARCEREIERLVKTMPTSFDPAILPLSVEPKPDRR